MNPSFLTGDRLVHWQSLFIRKHQNHDQPHRNVVKCSCLIQHMVYVAIGLIRMNCTFSRGIGEAEHTRRCGSFRHQLLTAQPSQDVLWSILEGEAQNRAMTKTPSSIAVWPRTFGILTLSALAERPCMKNIIYFSNDVLKRCHIDAVFIDTRFSSDRTHQVSLAYT